MNKIKHAIARLLVATLVLVPTSSVVAAGAVPDPISMPSLIIEPTQPLAFQPITVVARFSAAYCLSDAAPLLASASLRNGQLNLVLSHLRQDVCSAEKRLTLPSGLPPGAYTIRLSVTADDTTGGPSFYARTYEKEVGTVNTSVGYPAGWGEGALAMGRIDQLNTPGAPDVGAGPIQLNSDWYYAQLPFGSPQRIARPLLPATSAVPAAMMFVAARDAIVSSSAPPPSPWVPLYALDYPAPLLGKYFTTSTIACLDLAKSWGQSPSACNSAPFAALPPSASGMCPLGTAPVFQLFEPRVLAHRYTLDSELYLLLQQIAGYRGEGVAWCAMRPIGGGG
ncbi:MAG: hypothetical protein JNL19_12300 [Burkholderiales bacterium]|nr:hypothetical protein [Burkholderiales bacterium]